MIVEYTSGDGLRLVDPEDFKKFKVVLRGPLDAAQPDIDGVKFVDDANALVGIELVPGLPGAPAGEDWHAGYAKMLEAAAKYGWIDDRTRSIRAHVERES